MSGSATLGCVESLSPEGQRTVLEFFLVFARFEYALKRSTRFLRARKRDSGAEPNWKKFACEIEATYPHLDGDDFKQAREYILSRPPQRQVVDNNNKLDWQKLVQGEATEISFLLECIRTMRNNLFHGGKFPGLVVNGSERDLPLLSNGVVVLRAVATLDEEVRSWFDPDSETH
jgi:hypothetical protein